MQLCLCSLQMQKTAGTVFI
uniref:Uncharacterized protein n=1 Tax=Arundo donax TaxID=35708 RepID=A0A0A9BUG3_ARUDO